jgi:hypothetical protein
MEERGSNGKGIAFLFWGKTFLWERGSAGKNKLSGFCKMVFPFALVNKNWTLGHEKLDTKVECLKTPSLTEP